MVTESNYGEWESFDYIVTGLPGDGGDLTRQNDLSCNSFQLPREPSEICPKLFTLESEQNPDLAQARSLSDAVFGYKNPLVLKRKVTSSMDFHILVAGKGWIGRADARSRDTTTRI